MKKQASQSYNFAFIYALLNVGKDIDMQDEQ